MCSKYLENSKHNLKFTALVTLLGPLDGRGSREMQQQRLGDISGASSPTCQSKELLG